MGMEGEVGLGLLLIAVLVIGAVVVPYLWRSFRQADINPVGPVDYGDPKVQIMQRVIPAIVNSIDSNLASTQISYYNDDPDDVMTLIMDIEQFRHLRKKRTLWEHQGLFAERAIERKWARRPPAVREWEGIQHVVPVAANAAFGGSPSIRIVRMWIGDTEDYMVTICRVSVEATPGGRYDWRYDKRAKGYLAPVTPHGDRLPVLSAVGLAEDPYDFEQQVAQMLRSWGLAVEVTGGTGDEGIDVIAYDNTPVTGGTCLVQCKRYSPDNKVGVSAVRELYGTMQEKQVSKGVLVTSSAFTTGALRFAEGKSIDLIDGAQLSGLLANTTPGIGTARKDRGADVEGEPLSELPDVYLKADLDFSEPGETGRDPNPRERRVENDENQVNLVVAAIVGDVDALMEAIRNGADVNGVGSIGFTPLHNAISSGHTDVVHALLDHGADVHPVNESGDTALDMALYEAVFNDGDADVISALLDHGANVYRRDSGGQTPLHTAVNGSRLRPEIVSLLIEHGADVNTNDDDEGLGGTPLMRCVFRAHSHPLGPDDLTVMALLVNAGADTRVAYQLALNYGLSEEILSLLR